jgi:hypothetical protein
LLLLLFAIPADDCSAQTPPPPVDEHAFERVPPTVVKRLATRFSLGAFAGRFEEMPLGAVREAVGEGTIQHQGDAGDSIYWPKQNSSGGKQRLGRISKMGNRDLRRLLVVGAHAALFHRRPHTDPLRMWAKKLIEKKPFKLVAVALANKMARIAFAILRGNTVYREIPA